MTKLKTIYNCTDCGSQSPKWIGRCPDCGAWNSFQEDAAIPATSAKFAGYAGTDLQEAVCLADVELVQQERSHSGFKELDRVLGGGLVPGSVILIGGDPGIGKSTLLLQTLCKISTTVSALYITGEESPQQIALRAKRLQLPTKDLTLLPETRVEQIIATAKKQRPEVMVIDSIQTIFTEHVSSAPGSVSQVREASAQLVRFAKQTNTILFLVGHVTKEGALAGPRVLEHMVDTVLYFEGERDGRFRLLRAVKNRFGAVNELGVFAMAENGLREVNNPSALFLNRETKAIPGSIAMATWEGTRPLLVEVQTLVDESHLGNPRRVTVGVEQNRLAMLLAGLHRHAEIPTYNQDVFINVVGGLKITETASDLPILLAIISSLKNKPLPHDMLCFGEVGLGGEIRPVQNGQDRLHEAAKQGFKRAIIPKGNAPKTAIKDMQVSAVSKIEDVLGLI